MLIATALVSEATLRFVLLGAATGALTALVALSIVIVYRVSGVLNFAAGALGAIGAFVCYWLRDDQGWPPVAASLAGLGVGTAARAADLRGHGAAAGVVPAQPADRHAGADERRAGAR